MSKLVRAYLFGPLTLYQEDGGDDSIRNTAISLPKSSTARSLLAYLLLNRGTPQPRPLLAGVFWPDHSEARARRALTQALWQIRQCLLEIVQADPDYIHIPSEAPAWVDVDVFQALLHSQTTNPVPKSRGENLRQAIELYRGDLLEGFYDDWLLLERERFREMYLGALERLIVMEKTTGRYHQALDLALTLVGADPLREATHREIMRLLYALDRPEAALKQFETCRQILWDELVLEPEAETIALAGEIAGSIQSSPSCTG